MAELAAWSAARATELVDLAEAPEPPADVVDLARNLAALPLEGEAEVPPGEAAALPVEVVEQLLPLLPACALLRARAVCRCAAPPRPRGASAPASARGSGAARGTPHTVAAGWT